MYLILLLYAGFASVFTMGKAALYSTEPFFLVGSRMFFAGAVLLAYYLYKKGWSALKLSREKWICILCLAFLNIYVTNALEFWALKHLSSTKTCFFYSLSPFIAALGSFIFLSEGMTTKKWIGLIVGFIGFSPIIILGEEASVDALLAFSLPEAAILSAVVASAFGWIFLKKAVDQYSMDPFFANGISMFIGGMLSLAHSGVSETWNPIPTTDLYHFAILWIGLILVSNFFCYNIYGYILKKFSATFVSFCGFITPVFTAIWGFLFLNETIPLFYYPAFSVVFFGLFLFYQDELMANYEVAAN